MADSKVKYNTCQPVRSADANRLLALSPTPARRPRHHCQPEAAEPKRTSHRAPAAPLARHHQPGTAVQCLLLWLGQRACPVFVPAAQALRRASDQAAFRVDTVGPGDRFAAAALVARADCPDTGTLVSSPAMNTACHTKPSTTASMPCPWASCARADRHPAPPHNKRLPR